MPGIEDLLDRVRARYRVAFLSNSNETHAEVIPTLFAGLFHGPWLKFKRNTSAPTSNRLRTISRLELAGPRVAMILALR